MSLPRIRQITLDSNLLLLMSVGSFDPRLLRTFKRLSAYDARDLRLVQMAIRGRRLVITPHVLTEVMNLANGLPETTRHAYYRFLGVSLALWMERTPSAQELSQDPAFAKFGVADAALVLLANDTAVVTEDGRLRLYLTTLGLASYSLADLQLADISEQGDARS